MPAGHQQGSEGTISQARSGYHVSCGSHQRGGCGFPEASSLTLHSDPYHTCLQKLCIGCKTQLGVTVSLDHWDILYVCQAAGLLDNQPYAIFRPVSLLVMSHNAHSYAAV